MYLYTLQLHFKYILKILKLPESRLPHFIAKKIIQKKLYWYKEWLDMSEKYDCNIEEIGEDCDRLGESLDMVVCRVDTFYSQHWWLLASRSQHHSLYGELLLGESPRSYITNVNKLHYMGVLFRSRCQLLNLNFKPFSPDSSGLCTMCNRSEKEDCFHFLAVCPVLNEYRSRWLGKAQLSREEVIQYLNGKNWNHLYQYVTRASTYRKFLIDHYNE